jgi:hypothetical protein
LPVFVGSRRAALGDFFTVEGSDPIASTSTAISATSTALAPELPVASC